MAKQLEELAKKARGTDPTAWAFTLDKSIAIFGSEVTDTSPCGRTSKVVLCALPASSFLLDAGKELKRVSVVLKPVSDSTVASFAKHALRQFADGNVVDASVFVKFCPEKPNPFHTCSKYVR